MSLAVQGAFQGQHVLILLRIDVLVREVHGHALELNLHGNLMCCAGSMRLLGYLMRDNKRC